MTNGEGHNGEGQVWQSDNREPIEFWKVPLCPIARPDPRLYDPRLYYPDADQLHGVELVRQLFLDLLNIPGRETYVWHSREN